MFSRLQVFIAFVILGLFAGLVFQYQVITKLKEDNQALSQTLSKQEEANKELIRSLELEREAIIDYQQAVKLLREKANDTQKNIKAMLKAEPCTNTRLPDDAIKRLQSIGRD